MGSARWGANDPALRCRAAHRCRGRRGRRPPSFPHRPGPPRCAPAPQAKGRSTRRPTGRPPGRATGARCPRRRDRHPVRTGPRPPRRACVPADRSPCLRRARRGAPRRCAGEGDRNPNSSRTPCSGRRQASRPVERVMRRTVAAGRPIEPTTPVHDPSPASITRRAYAAVRSPALARCLPRRSCPHAHRVVHRPGPGAGERSDLAYRGQQFRGEGGCTSARRDRRGPAGAGALAARPHHAEPRSPPWPRPISSPRPARSSARAPPAAPDARARSPPSSTGTAPTRSTSRCPSWSSSASCASRAATPSSRSTSRARPQLALTKTVVAHPIRPYIEHVDLLVIRRGEKVMVEVALVVTGDAAPGTLVTQELNTLEVECDVSSIPEQIEVSVEGLRIGTQIHAGDLTLPANTELRGDPELLVVNVVAATEADAGEEPEAAETDAEADAEPRPARRSPRPTRRSDRDAGPRPGGRARQPRPRVRRHPSQRRLPRGRAARRPGGRRAVLPAPVERRRAGGPARRAPGGAGEAAHVHERVRAGRWPGWSATTGASSSSCTTTSTSASASCGSSRAAARAGTTGCARSAPRWARRTTCACASASAVRPGRQDPADFVLKRFSATERKELEFAVDLAADATEALLADGLEPTQNRFHALSG